MILSKHKHSYPVTLTNLVKDYIMKQHPESSQEIHTASKIIVVLTNFQEQKKSGMTD